MTKMLGNLERQLRRELGDAVTDCHVEHMCGSPDVMDLVTLVATLNGVGRERRRAVRKKLFEMISNSGSVSVRERVTVSFR